MPTCDFCHQEKPKGKTYVKYTGWETDQHTANLLVARVTTHRYTNFERHEFFVCNGCAGKRWLIVEGIFAVLALILALFIGPAFRDDPTKAGIWTFAISFLIFFILFSPLFLNFGSKFTTRLKKGNRGIEVFSEADYKNMTKTKN
jgi:uncharacterized membrane protein